MNVNSMILMPYQSGFPAYKHEMWDNMETSAVCNHLFDNLIIVQVV